MSPKQDAERVAIPLASLQTDTQVFLTWALVVGVGLALGLVAGTISGDVVSDSACAPPESYSGSARAEAIAWLQLALLVGLACSLLYGPVHWKLITLTPCVVHVTLSIVFVAWPPHMTSDTAEALLYVTALAPGATSAFHYAILQKARPGYMDAYLVKGLFVLALGLVIAQCALAGLLWTGSDTAPNLALAASVVEVVGAPAAFAIFRAGML